MVFLPIWGEKWRRSEHAHASYPGLFFSPARVQPLYPWGWVDKEEFRNWTRGTYTKNISASIKLENNLFENLVKDMREVQKCKEEE